MKLNAEQQGWIERAEQYVYEELYRDSSGHDWWHIARVRRLAVRIAGEEGADVLICELAALLHDVADAKLNLDHDSGLQKVEQWLESNGIEPIVRDKVLSIIANMSYNGGNNPPMDSIEGQVVQDADRLDAMGAIGIGRTFAYAGWKGHLMHDPNLAAREAMTESEYRQQPSTAINHFTEKLLKLKALMNTSSGKQLAHKRHLVMEEFLEQFHKEWNAEDDK
ncbi:HD domain-containing protein [Paenibacillus sp. chi10]|uniref:HD domain-containing protein n=1 Tax=Paenibacillus suaedae TaxID=3077233 RepID=A0AAJ2K1K0_9BACL|nr:HD domain-containing protein [Paenibacillus sp. chi10]MDT8978860.1 HD domain-containing protein [Paenibacillus sp. chi10]